MGKAIQVFVVLIVIGLGVSYQNCGAPDKDKKASPSDDGGNYDDQIDENSDPNIEEDPTGSPTPPPGDGPAPSPTATPPPAPVFTNCRCSVYNSKAGQYVPTGVVFGPITGAKAAALCQPMPASKNCATVLPKCAVESTNVATTCTAGSICGSLPYNPGTSWQPSVGCGL